MPEKDTSARRDSPLASIKPPDFSYDAPCDTPEDMETKHETSNPTPSLSEATFTEPDTGGLTPAQIEEVVGLHNATYTDEQLDQIHARQGGRTLAEILESLKTK